MYTEFHINANSLDINFLNKVKELFKSKTISITIEEEQDETEYLLQSPANKEILLKSIEQANNGELIKVALGKARKK